jgi:hypothetical protein
MSELVFSNSLYKKEETMSNLLNSPQMLIRLHHDIMTSVNAIQGDTGRLWHFVIDDYEIPTNAEIRLYVEKPSGKRIYNPGILQDSIISFQPTVQTLAETGQSIGQIQITLNKQTITSYPFFLNVSKNYVLNAGIESTDEFLILDNLIDDAQKTLAEMKALITKVTNQENARVEAEKKRITAENARIEAEKQRQETLKNILDAADNANAKATLAQEAADNANNKAGLADRAQGLATQAAEKANKAAQDAWDAIEGIQGAVGGIINDTTPSVATTYSSNKINSLFASANIKAITNSQIDSLGTL